MSDSMLNNKLFLGSLVTTVTEAQIRSCFADIDEVGEVKICRDENNFCRGFAFLTIGGDHENFNKALNKRVHLEGRLLDISEVVNANMRDSIMQNLIEHKIFVKNLPLEIDDEKLRLLFLKYGDIKKAYVIYHYRTTISKRYGYVEFKAKESANKS